MTQGSKAPEIGRRRPNFFIVGSPKSGTTAMVMYLAQHPAIFMSTVDEPHFFNDDLVDPTIRRDRAEDEYLELFAAAKDQPVVGEKSVFYLFSQVAAKRIKDFEPDARLLVMIRNPVDLVHSFHNQLRFTGQESIKDFEEAWRLQSGRGGTPLLQYGAVARQGAHLARLLKTFPREQIHVVVYDDFRSDTLREYRGVLTFLGVEDDGRTDFPVINANRRYRSRTLAKLISALPNPRLIKKILGIDRLRISDRVDRINVVESARSTLDPSLRAELQQHFEEDVQLLSEILGRDFSGWTNRDA